MRITLRDVAMEAGTSTAAASATLSGSRGSVRVSPQTREQIIAAAARLGYVPNPIAKSLSTGRTGVIGLMFPYADAFLDKNPFCSQVMNGVFAEAISDNFHMMLYTGADNQWGNGRTIDPRVDGLVIVLPDPEEPLLSLISEKRFPCVAVVCPPLVDILTINADDFGGGMLATNHLIGLGHQRIAILTGGDRVCTNQPRLQGYKTAMQTAGFPVNEDLIMEAGFDWRPGFNTMNEILDRPRRHWPTAIFAINDLCAVGAMRAIKARGLSIPEDFAVVGFDDTWFAAASQPSPHVGFGPHPRNGTSGVPDGRRRSSRRADCGSHARLYGFSDRS